MKYWLLALLRLRHGKVINAHHIKSIMKLNLSHQIPIKFNNKHKLDFIKTRIIREETEWYAWQTFI